MNDLEKAKVERFINDQVTSNAVYRAIQGSFLRKKGAKDVHVLAAERLAVDLLDDAWKDLAKLSTQVEESMEVAKQVGL